MEVTFIYILIDPITNQVRYVGKANNISQRYKAHLNRARKHQIHKANWIKSLKEKGLKPIIEVIDEVPIDNWIFWETYWISQFKTWGFKLINYTDGGEGATFGNQTSFKKGHKPWNSGTIINRTCPECNIKFLPKTNTSKQIYCSYSCAGKNRSSKTQFKKGMTPWNKEKSGYSTKKLKPVFQFDLEGNFIRKFNSAKEAGDLLGCSRMNIQNACIGRSKTAKNYKWSYSND